MIFSPRDTVVMYAKFFFLGFACFFSCSGHAWNALGHRLAVQIAMDNLDGSLKKKLNQYHRLDNHLLSKIAPMPLRKKSIVFRRMSLVDTGPWMDILRYDNVLWLEKKHYINIPFSRDGTPLNPPYPQNAVTAIKNAHQTLWNPASSDFDKGFNLRILLHVVGDLHQPLHSTSQFSKRFPQGDLGGNLMKLGKNPVADNLHAYWDRGGGMLIPKGRIDKKRLQKWAHRIEKKWPCSTLSQNLDPQHWALQSHRLAVDVAYQVQYKQKPSKAYQRQTQALSERQIALAGCRLAGLLKKV